MTLSEITAHRAVVTDNPNAFVCDEPPLRIETVLYVDRDYIGTDSGTYLVKNGNAARGSRKIIGVIDYLAK